MVDPVTVGTFVAGALGMATETALKGAVGEAVKDGYKALKESISRWTSGNEIAALETTPASAGRQMVIAALIDARPKDDRE